MDLPKWNLGAGSKPRGDKQMMKGPGLFPVYFPLLGESVVTIAEPAAVKLRFIRLMGDEPQRA